nr:hypothetical protein [Tanacetum cinerariifolium]
MIAVNNQRDSVSPPPLAAKPKKGKSQTVTSTSPKSQGLEASGALSKKSKRPMPNSHPLKPRDKQLASIGFPSTLDEGTRKSKPLLEGIDTHPKDSGGNKQLLDRDITFMTPDEGTAKTMSRSEGSLGEKDSEGNKPPAKMKPLHTTDINFLGTGAKYQVDETQSSRLRYQSLTKNKGKPSYEGDLDTQPMILSYADVRASHLFDDEAQESKEDILEACDKMDDNPQSDETQHQSLPPHGDKPTSSTVPHPEASDTDSSSDSILKKYDNTFPLIERQDKEEEIKKANEEARLNAISKKKVIKVVREEAKKIGIYPKEEIFSKAGELFKKAEDVENEVLKRQHTEKIHLKTKPVVIIVYRGTNGRIFDVHKPFLFVTFGISELDELREIIPKKKNTMVKDLMNPLSQRWTDIDKVAMEALVSYLVAVFMVKSPENARFSMKLRKLIAKRPDQEKLKSKKVKLEALVYKMNLVLM